MLSIAGVKADAASPIQHAVPISFVVPLMAAAAQSLGSSTVSGITMDLVGAEADVVNSLIGFSTQNHLKALSDEQIIVPTTSLYQTASTTSAVPKQSGKQKIQKKKYKSLSRDDESSSKKRRIAISPTNDTSQTAYATVSDTSNISSRTCTDSGEELRAIATEWNWYTGKHSILCMYMLEFAVIYHEPFHRWNDETHRALYTRFQADHSDYIRSEKEVLDLLDTTLRTKIQKTIHTNFKLFKTKVEQMYGKAAETDLWLINEIYYETLKEDLGFSRKPVISYDNRLIKASHGTIDDSVASKLAFPVIKSNATHSVELQNIYQQFFPTSNGAAVLSLHQEEWSYIDYVRKLYEILNIIPRSQQTQQFIHFVNTRPLPNGYVIPEHEHGWAHATPNAAPITLPSTKSVSEPSVAQRLGADDDNVRLVRLSEMSVAITPILSVPSRPSSAVSVSDMDPTVRARVLPTAFVEHKRADSSGSTSSSVPSLMSAVSTPSDCSFDADTLDRSDGAVERMLDDALSDYKLFVKSEIDEMKSELRSLAKIVHTLVVKNLTKGQSTEAQQQAALIN